ncbi:MAG: ATP-dependent sacrificial sulfur transferase LarE [Syntrophales bacterium]|nr:ATP-dependent sacrificial sulfur transferase LarE [Syntrophales bacterium]
MKDKLKALRNRLGELVPCVIAFSGGQDSTFLLDLARELLGDNVKAVTISAPHTLKRDLLKAGEIAEALRVEHRIVEITMPEGLRFNPEDRCYICKSTFIGSIRRAAEALGIGHVMDGTNADDSEDLRPGIRALRENMVLSPLHECGFTKADIAGQLRARGNENWMRHSDSCLLTRLPHGHEVTPEDLARTEMAEEYLLKEGIEQVRVRNDGLTARIETARDCRKLFFPGNFMDRVAFQLKAFGFRHVTLDLEGYRTGGMNT